MGGAAASGGYWISSPANYIFAEPTTITGSIGIFGLIPNFSGLVTDKLGITFDGVKTHQFAGYETELVAGKDTQEIMRQMQNYINRGYQNFLNVVAEGRGLKPEQVNEIGQGRVWLASDALGIKLVDKLGSLDDAVKKAAELAKLQEYHTATYPAEPGWFEKLMSKESKGSYLDGQIRELLGDAYLPLMQIRNDLKNNSRMQARMLDDIRVK
jgi:protease-4